MADRYLRASGNWNGAVWAATSGGTAGSAATPTASDDVYIAANYSVTVNVDSECKSVSHTNGTLAIGSKKLTVMGNGGAMGFDAFKSTGTLARTISFTTGTLDVTLANDMNTFTLSGSNLTFTAGKGHIVLRVPGTADPTFGTLSKTFNDVAIYLGDKGSTAPHSIDITGSPTFRTLIIESKNSWEHTVDFDNGATITTNKFVAIGSSSSYKLTVKPSSGSSTIALSSGGSSYGQFVDMQASASGAGVPKYIGANSTQSSGMGWLLQDPPKISTLVDPLTTAPGSNSNWTATGTVGQITSGVGGGGYELSPGAKLISTDTYDLVGSDFIFQIPNISSREMLEDDMAVSVGDPEHVEASLLVQLYYGEIYMGTTESAGLNWAGYVGTDITGDYFKISIDASTGEYYFGNSSDGVTWTDISDVPISVDTNLFRSARVYVEEFYDDSVEDVPLGSINLSPPNNTGSFFQFF